MRRDRLVTGATAPFILDPSRFFEALLALPRHAIKIGNSSSTTYKGKDVLLIGVTFAAEDAQDFALSGALPAVQAGGGRMMMLGLGGRGGGTSLPDVTVDLAFYVEPKTSFIHKVKARCYQESPMQGNFRIQIGGGGGGFGGDDDEEDEADEEVQEKDKDGNRIYKRGLPIRKLEDDLSKLDYDVTFTKHGQPVEVKLDPRARKLLRFGGN